MNDVVRSFLELPESPLHNSVINLLYQRVPFLIKIPALLMTGERATIGEHIDIAPTLLDLFGIEPPLSYLGRSLLLEGDDESLVANSRPLEGAINKQQLFHSEIQEGANCIDR